MPEQVVRVITDRSIDRALDYSVPVELGPVHVGSRVCVPLGKSKADGVVVSIPEDAHPRLKPIIAVLGDGCYLDDHLQQLARWMADYYCSSVEAAIRTVLPGAVRRRGAGFKEQLHAALVEDPVGPALHAGPPAKPALPPKPLTPKQQALTDCLRSKGSMPAAILLKQVGCTMAPLKALERKGVITLTKQSLRRDPSAHRNILLTEPLELMPEQAEALQMTLNAVASAEEGTGDPHVVLLHGVTGSGKTEVYLQAIEAIRAQGKGGIVLVPEIALTPQTVDRFRSRFGDRVGVLHSHLSDGERHDEWHRIRDGGVDVVVGARSAVFAPIPRLGLIVVDEEHEPSYKQEDAPRYHARDVAVMRAHREGCAVVLGSATPSLESWRNAQAGKYLLASLPRRADDRQMPMVRVVDMRLEAQETGQVGVFSRVLVDAVQARLQRAEQTILFLNRRGFSTSLVCQHCGYVAACADCSVSLTYHRTTEELRCHICGHAERVPSRCPGCNDPTFKYSGIGTQRVENIVGRLFPKARVRRMDADVTTRKDSYDEILGDFRSGQIDILIGTQMIAKGLHFPNVTLVGVVFADLSLHMPDFRAGERTFQLLAQVAGRAGRGEVPGEVVVQTFTPFHEAVQAARRVDFDGFADQELEFRRELGYPPWGRLILVTFTGRNEDKVAFSSASLAKKLMAAVPAMVRVSEAGPAPLARAKGMYRYQVMIRTPAAGTVVRALRPLLATRWPDNVKCSVDVDAVSLL